MSVVFVSIALMYWAYCSSNDIMYSASAEICVNPNARVVTFQETGGVLQSNTREMSWLNNPASIRNLDILELAASYLLKTKPAARIDNQGNVLQEFDFSEFLKCETSQALSAPGDNDNLNGAWEIKDVECNDDGKVQLLQQTLNKTVDLQEKKGNPWSSNEYVISTTNKDPRVAQMIVNAVALAAEQYYLIYAKQALCNVIAKTREDLSKFQDEEAAIKMKRLEFYSQAQTKSPQFKPGFDFTEKEKMLHSGISALNVQIETLKIKVKSNLALYDAKLNIKVYNDLKKFIPEGIILSFPELEKIHDEIRECKRDISTLKNSVPHRTDQHPSVIVKEIRLKELETELAQIVEKVEQHEFQLAAHKEEVLLQENKLLEIQINMLETFFAERNNELAVITGLKDELSAIDKSKDSVAQKIENQGKDLKNLQLGLTMIENPVFISEWAKPESVRKIPAKGTKTEDILLLAVLSLIVATFIAWTAEYFDTKIRSEFDVRKHLNLPVLGFVPNVPANEASLVTTSPFSRMGESFNVISSTIKASAGEAKLLLVTSCDSRAGKSLSSVNLSIALARKRHKVILIDADMRHPSVHEYFGLENSVGLSNILEGEIASNRIIQEILSSQATATSETMDYDIAAEYIQATSIAGLKVVTTGPIPSDPVNILGSKNTTLFLDYFKTHADFVIIDSPPLKMVGDALSLAPHVGGVVLVVGANETERHDLTWAKRLLKNIQPNIIGVILNRTSERHQKEYYYYSNKLVKQIREH